MKLDLTQTGIDFLLHCLEGGPSPIFTEIALGNGANAGDAATALTNRLARIGITDIQRLENEQFVTLTGVLNNNSIVSRFRANEMGVFIQHPDYPDERDKDLLFAYGYSTDDEAILIPANTDYAFETIENVIVYVGTTENVSAILTESFTTVSKAEFNEHIENFGNPHFVTKMQVGLGNVENYSVNDQPPTYTVAAEITELKSGEKMTTLLGKVAKAIQGLISHLGDKANPHKVTLAQVGAAASTHYHNASQITSGTLSYDRGGTGVTSYSALRGKLGLGTGTGVLAVGYGGTGLSSLTGSDYTTSRVRGISIQSSVPTSISNGHIVGVYSS